MGDQLRSTATMLLMVAGVFGLLTLVGAYLLAEELGGTVVFVTALGLAMILAPYVGLSRTLQGLAELLDQTEKAPPTNSSAQGLEPLEEESPHGYYPDPGTPGQLRWWDGRAWDTMTKPDDR